MKCLLALVILVILSTAASSQGVRPNTVREFPAYKIYPGALDSDGFPTSGAKLCVVDPAGDCFQMPSNSGYSEGGAVYDYGLEPHAQRQHLVEGGSLVFFSAVFSGGGSGTLESLAVLRYEGGGHIANLLPFAGVTNQGETAMWPVPRASRYPILLTADADWREGETHLAQHFFLIEAYRFDPGKGQYLKLFAYRTSKKYPSLDDVDQIRVLGPERANILRRVGVSRRSR